MLPQGLYDDNKIRQAKQLRNAGYKVTAIAELLDVTQEAVRLMTYDSELANVDSAACVEKSYAANRRRAALLVAKQMIVEGYSRERVIEHFRRWLPEGAK